MTLYRYDADGIYTGSIEAQVNPVASSRKGSTVYFDYPNSTKKKPELIDGYVARWTGKMWKLEEKQETAEELKQYLADTDYVGSKILDAIAQNSIYTATGKTAKAKEYAQEAQSLALKYKDILDKREAVRKKIDELEAKK